jgi:MATE family multidrug resistance protein
VAVALGLLLASRALPLWRCPLARVFVAARLRRLLRVSADIMVRTLALVFVFVWFTSKSAGQGDIALAANTVLMHFVSTSAYFLDGLAFAAESLVGRALGSGSRRNLQSAVRITTLWSVGVALATSGILFALGGPLIDLLTIDASARALAREFLPWAAAAPLLGSWAFQLDGIFIGATRTREMRNAMLAATGVFLVAWWLLTPFGNHGLWAAFWIHYIARIAGLAVFYSRLVVSVPA